jgi:hypothetical protein
MWPGQVPHHIPLLLALHGRDELMHCAEVLRSLEAVQHPMAQVRVLVACFREAER